jgi:hypothetical protein
MITVVIPLYNKAPHIKGTLQSILSQTVQPAEIIVVDDGSTDNGPEIVDTFADHGVRLIQQPNQGESAARNTGVDAAKTDYVAFLDADDQWLPEHLATLSNLVRSFPDASLCSTAHLIQREDRLYRARSPFVEGWRGMVDDFFTTYSQGLSLVNSSTACVRRSALLESGGFPVGIRRGPDIITWVKLALHHPVAHAAVATAIYNQQAVNRTDTLREIEPPGSLQYLAKLMCEPGLSQKQEHGVARLFDRIAFFTAAGFKSHGDLSAVHAIRRLAVDAKRYPTALMIASLALAPAGLLRVAKRLRHSRVSPVNG